MTDKRMDDLIRKIRALKAKAEGTTNEHEAAAFAAKVAEMLAEHGLAEAQLETSQQAQAGTEHEFTKKWTETPQRRILMSALCKLYMVKPIVHSGGMWNLIGRRVNIMMVLEMAEYLVKTTMRMSREWRRREGRMPREEIEFRKGCFVRLSERVRAMSEETRSQEAPRVSSTGVPQNLPALIRNEVAVNQQYAMAMYPKLGKSRAIKVNARGSAADAGRAAGDRVSLNRQVGGGGARTMLIGSK